MVSNDLSQARGFTLTAIIRNEMYFLPAFLRHYRTLGVKRFIFLDDQSDDDSRAFLCAQDDVMVVESKYRFGDQIPEESGHQLGLSGERMCLMWRSLLVAKYCGGEWSLHLDADEFLSLPQGQTMEALVESFANTDATTGWAVMLDMYPTAISDLSNNPNKNSLDPDAGWYFDGRPHLALNGSDEPKMVYPGCRARILHTYHLHPRTKKIERYLPFLRPNPRAFNAIRKPILLKWSADSFFETNHRVTPSVPLPMILPLMHFKFTPHIHEKIQKVVASGQHFRGGWAYRHLDQALAAMAEHDARFLDACSVKHSGFEDFRRTGNAIGFD
ncbi:glycosyl transferase family 2 [Yoonia maricola]|uniref:Glycosyl transferase family 2 n=1 Tax=Yoonia maricola TaxID=420999 RepID=A0A2M8WNM8_9RHOB|nr:glycosyl transferase family 2 [Yoonia maricola]